MDFQNLGAQVIGDVGVGVDGIDETALGAWLGETIHYLMYGFAKILVRGS